jgi:hypothetical protein
VSELIKAAKLFANSNHRRITVHRNPALQSCEVHLKSVAQLVSSVSQDEHVIAAAWLHDVVEDTAVTIGAVERKFGSTVGRLVGELTMVSHRAPENDTIRIARTKEHFSRVSAAAKTIKLADLIETCRDMYKNAPTAFSAYLEEVHALVKVLEGGDTRLLGRLTRDLEKYSSDSFRSAPASTAEWRFESIALPISVLRIFERAFTALDIAEPLLSFDSNHAANEALVAMTDAGVGVAGVRRNGAVSGFLEASSLDAGSCEAYWQEFKPGQVLVAGSSLTEVIEVLTHYDWCFVSVLGTVVGMISRKDMEKPAVRMWLFGIVTVAELEFTERVRQKWANESWRSLLSQQRLEKAKQLYGERERRNEKCQLVDCLQLADKMEILMSDPSELAALGISTQGTARRASKHIESLRNSLAHAQSFVAQDWPQVVRLARRIQQMVLARVSPAAGPSNPAK